MLRSVPYARLAIRTPLPPEDVRQRLAEVIEPGPPFRFTREDQKPYVGTLEADRFTVMRRIVHERPLFRPVIRGEMRQDPTGTLMEITMRPRIFALVITIISAGFYLTLMCATLVFRWYANEHPSGLNDIAHMNLGIPEGLQVIMYLLAMAGFESDAAESTEFFQSLVAYPATVSEG